MAATIEVMDDFAWCGGQGRFGPGAFTAEYVDYRVGGIFGDLAVNLALAFYWNGIPAGICSMWSPPFNKFPDGGCDPGADPPRECEEGISTLQFGGFGVDAAGHVYFSGYTYLGGGYDPSACAAYPTGGPRLVAKAWNFVELKLELAGAVMSGGGSGCGDIDPAPGSAYGFVSARINGTESLRKRVRDGDGDNVPYTACACFLCAAFPLGIGRIRLWGQIWGADRTYADDFTMRSWVMTEGEDAWIGEGKGVFLPAAAAGSSAQWTPVGAATNAAAAATDDGATSYNETAETGKRDAFALASSADTSPVLAAQPVIVARNEYIQGGGPPMKAFYRRSSTDYATAALSTRTTFGPVTGAAGVPLVGETVATLSAGEIGYTTE